jgi:hypothetical protein
MVMLNPYSVACTVANRLVTRERLVCSVMMRARYDFAANKMTGFRHPSNIFAHEGFLYTIIGATSEGEQKSGNCLFRTSNIADAGSWTYLTDTGWSPSSYNPYDDLPAPPSCEPLAKLGGIVWSVVKRETSGDFLALSTIAAKQPNKVDLAISVSKDLKKWTTPVPFYSIVAAWNSDCSTPYRYNYPSIVDPHSSSANFDTVAGSGILFMSRIQMSACSQTMRRDAIGREFRLEDQ